jgi:hypothetical protein
LELKATDFAPPGGLILLPEPRKRYVAALMQRFGRGDIDSVGKSHSADATLRGMLWRLTEEIRGSGEFVVPKGLR